MQHKKIFLRRQNWVARSTQIDHSWLLEPAVVQAGTCLLRWVRSRSQVGLPGAGSAFDSRMVWGDISLILKTFPVYLPMSLSKVYPSIQLELWNDMCVHIIYIYAHIKHTYVLVALCFLRVALNSTFQKSLLHGFHTFRCRCLLIKDFQPVYPFHCSFLKT